MLSKNDRFEMYKTYGVRIGAKNSNKLLQQFIFKRVPNKFVVFNIKSIDERISLGAKFLSQFKRKDILLVCTLDDAYYPVYNFVKLMNVSVNFGRYLAGSLTNLSYKNFFEPKVLFVTDPNSGRRAINDARKNNIPIMAIVDTDSRLNYIDFMIPGNNKKKESLGVILFLLAHDMADEKEKQKLNSISFEDFISKELEI